MANLVVTYGAPGRTVVQHRVIRDPQGQLICGVATFKPDSPRRDTMTFVVSEARTLVKGDRIHSYPFTGTYRTVVPMSGVFDINMMLKLVPPAVNPCGDQYGDIATQKIDIGLYATNPAAINLPVVSNNVRAFHKDYAETKALADLNRSLMNIPLLFAERVETVGLIRDKANQLVALARARQDGSLRRWGRTRAADKRKIARDAAGEHLAFLFGVLPLIDEIKGLTELLTKTDPVKITGRGRSSSNAISVENLSVSHSGKSSITSEPSFQALKTTTSRYSHRASITVTVTSQQMAALRDLGFNPLAVAYDLVPLSFLSDFVSNLGSFLRASDLSAGYDFLSGSSTSYNKISCEVSAQGVPAFFNRADGAIFTSVTHGSGKGVTETLQVIRTPLATYPDPTLMWANNLTISKAGTLASLSIQRFLKPLKRALALKEFRYRGRRPRTLRPIKYR